MTTTIYNTLSPHIPEWQKYALRYFEEHLEAVNLTGACHVDELETPELPQQIFMQLYADWDAEPTLVQEIISSLKAEDADLIATTNELHTTAIQLREMESGLLGGIALKQDFLAAQKETLWEKLTDTNYKDIMAFQHELSTTLHRAMFEAAEWHMAKIIDEVSKRLKSEITHIDPACEITFPFDGCNRMCLKDAIAAILEKGYTYMIQDTIQYNVILRDAYRDMGAEAFTKELLAIADNDEKLASRMQDFNEKIAEKGGLADYDIQAYNINEPITFFGVTVQGLEGLKQRIECGCRDEKYEHTYPCNPIVSDIHVGEIWHSYPMFDIYDMADNRTYNNYVVRNHKITPKDIATVIDLPYEANYIRVTEHISKDCLPIVYYEGSGNKILVATAKQI